MILEMLADFGITGNFQVLVEFVMLFGLGKLAFDAYGALKK